MSLLLHFCCCQAFLPLLKKAAAKAGDTGLGCSRAAILNITSRMGSIDDNTSGGNYPYRTSKVCIMCSPLILPPACLAGVLSIGQQCWWLITRP